MKAYKDNNNDIIIINNNDNINLKGLAPLNLSQSELNEAVGAFFFKKYGDIFLSL